MCKILHSNFACKKQLYFSSIHGMNRRHIDVHGFAILFIFFLFSSLPIYLVAVHFDWKRCFFFISFILAGFQCTKGTEAVCVFSKRFKYCILLCLSKANQSNGNECLLITLYLSLSPTDNIAKWQMVLFFRLRVEHRLNDNRITIYLPS